MNTSEKYLRPEVIRQVSRLDLRAKFIVQGFLTGLHASPFHGFSVEFSEHRKYTPGDDLNSLEEIPPPRVRQAEINYQSNAAKAKSILRPQADEARSPNTNAEPSSTDAVQPASFTESPSKRSLPQLQRLPAVAGGLHVISVGDKTIPQQLPNIRIVVHDQDTQRCGARRFDLIPRDERKRELKGAPFSLLAFDRDGPAVEFDEFLDDGKAQPQAL